MDSHTIEDLVRAGSPAAAAVTGLGALAAAIVALWLQAGFGLMTTGMVRAKNAAHALAGGVMTFAAGVLGYWAVGFAIQTAGHSLLHAGPGLSWAGARTLLPNLAAHPAMAPELLIFGVAALVPAMIPVGAIAERARLGALTAFAFVITGLLYSVFAHWVWGGGWLVGLGTRFGLGHGVVDCGGSGAIHMTGGMIALVATKMVGSRLGKYGLRGDVRPIPAHSMPLAVLGTALLASAWLVLQTMLSLLGSQAQLGGTIANTLLACAAGAMAAFFHTRLRFGKPDLTMMCNGLLAGLVAIAAAGSLVSSASALLIGAVASTLAIEAALWGERRFKIDDPVGAFGVHGVAGAWGLLAVGLFADGRTGDGLNGVAGPVRGLVTGSAGQLGASCIGIVANLLWVVPLAVLTLALLARVVDLRAGADDEIGGLDVPELGMTGYVTEAVHAGSTRSNDLGHAGPSGRATEPRRSLAQG